MEEGAQAESWISHSEGHAIFIPQHMNVKPTEGQEIELSGMGKCQYLLRCWEHMWSPIYAEVHNNN